MTAGVLFTGKVCPFFVTTKGGKNMNEVVEKEVKIENMIYKIGGTEVML